MGKGPKRRLARRNGAVAKREPAVDRTVPAMRFRRCDGCVCSTIVEAIECQVERNKEGP